jgi:hypothetical protein
MSLRTIGLISALLATTSCSPNADELFFDCAGLETIFAPLGTAEERFRTIYRVDREGRQLLEIDGGTERQICPVEGCVYAQFSEQSISYRWETDGPWGLSQTTLLFDRNVGSILKETTLHDPKGGPPGRIVQEGTCSRSDTLPQPRI